MIQNAPILLFCYKRLDSLQQTISALKKCVYAAESELYIFSDGAKAEKDMQPVEKVRAFIKDITGFKKVIVRESQMNRGLASSIIEGVTHVLKFSERVIVLEDDLVVSTNFLAYMNHGLEYYNNNSKVYSISGYTIPMKVPNGYPYDVYFLPRASSWGWATWKNRWENIDWTVSDFVEFSRNNANIRQFNKGGSDLFSMLKKQMYGEIDSWAIRWCYHQYKTQTYSVFPVSSMVQNIGFTSDATNTYVYNRYQTILDGGSRMEFKFPNEIELNSFFLGQFQHFYSKYARLISKIKTYIIKASHK